MAFSEDCLDSIKRCLESEKVEKQQSKLKASKA